MTRALVLLVAVVSAALAPVTEASADVSCPDARPCLVVTWTGTSSGSQVVTLDDLRAWADLSDPAYQTRVIPGTDPQSEPRPGQALSLHHLLGQLTPPIPAAAVTFTEAPHRGSAPSTLSTADLGDPSDPGYPFPDGLMPAVFIVGADDAIGYIRPLRSSTDTNGDDFWQTDSGGALQLTVHTTGRLVAPTLTAANHHVVPGARDSFTTSFATSPRLPFTYTWTFGDGATDVTRTAGSSHAYTTPGTYLATVTVRGDDGSYGQSPAVQITVGRRPSSTPTSTGPPGTGSSRDTARPLDRPDARRRPPGRSVGHGDARPDGRGERLRRRHDATRDLGAEGSAVPGHRPDAARRPGPGGRPVRRRGERCAAHVVGRCAEGRLTREQRDRTGRPPRHDDGRRA